MEFYILIIIKINLCVLTYFFNPFFVLTKKTKLKKHRKYLAHCEAQPILACSLKYLQLNKINIVQQFRINNIITYSILVIIYRVFMISLFMINCFFIYIT